MGVVNSDFSVLLYERVLPRGKYESFLKKIDLLLEHLEPSKTGVANNLSQLLQRYNLWNKVIVNVISYLCVSPAVKRFIKLIPLQTKRPLILPRLSRLQLAAFINKIKWIGIFCQQNCH